jgi:hypothetical protein
MRRIVLVLSLVAAMALMIAGSAATALAQVEKEWP